MSRSPLGPGRMPQHFTFSAQAGGGPGGSSSPPRHKSHDLNHETRDNSSPPEFNPANNSIAAALNASLGIAYQSANSNPTEHNSLPPKNNNLTNPTDSKHLVVHQNYPNSNFQSEVQRGQGHFRKNYSHTQNTQTTSSGRYQTYSNNYSQRNPNEQRPYRINNSKYATEFSGQMPKPTGQYPNEKLPRRYASGANQFNTHHENPEFNRVRKQSAYDDNGDKFLGLTPAVPESQGNNDDGKFYNRSNDRTQTAQTGQRSYYVNPIRSNSSRFQEVDRIEQFDRRTRSVTEHKLTSVHPIMAPAPTSLEETERQFRLLRTLECSVCHNLMGYQRRDLASSIPQALLCSMKCVSAFASANQSTAVHAEGTISAVETSSFAAPKPPVVAPLLVPAPIVVQKFEESFGGPSSDVVGRQDPSRFNGPASRPGFGSSGVDRPGGGRGGLRGGVVADSRGGYQQARPENGGFEANGRSAVGQQRGRGDGRGPPPDRRSGGNTTRQFGNRKEDESPFNKFADEDSEWGDEPSEFGLDSVDHRSVVATDELRAVCNQVVAQARSNDTKPGAKADRSAELKQQIPEPAVQQQAPAVTKPTPAPAPVVTKPAPAPAPTVTKPAPAPKRTEEESSRPVKPNPSADSVVQPVAREQVPVVTKPAPAPAPKPAEQESSRPVRPLADPVVKRERPAEMKQPIPEAVIQEQTPIATKTAPTPKPAEQEPARPVRPNPLADKIAAPAPLLPKASPPLAKPKPSRKTYMIDDQPLTEDIYPNGTVKIAFVWNMAKYFVVADDDGSTAMHVQALIGQREGKFERLKEDEVPLVGEVLLGDYGVNDLYRAVVVKVYEDTKKCLVEFLDFGDSALNTFDQLRIPTENLIQLPIYGLTVNLVLQEELPPSNVISRTPKVLVSLLTKPMQVEFVAKFERNGYVRLWASETETLNDFVDNLFKKYHATGSFDTVVAAPEPEQ